MKLQCFADHGRGLRKVPSLIFHGQCLVWNTRYGTWTLEKAKRHSIVTHQCLSKMLRFVLSDPRRFQAKINLRLTLNFLKIIYFPKRGLPLKNFRFRWSGISLDSRKTEAWESSSTRSRSNNSISSSISIGGGVVVSSSSGGRCRSSSSSVEEKELAAVLLDPES